MLQNPFVRSIIAPILLTVISALVEYLVQAVKGKSKGENMYRVWIKEPVPPPLNPVSPPAATSSNPQQFNFFPYTPRSITFLYSRNDFIHVEPLISFDLSDFGSVSINLILGAFSIDIGYLFESKGIQPNTGWILIVQLFALAAILNLLTLNNQAEPPDYPELDNDSKRRNKKLRSYKNFVVFIAIALGVFSMAVTFYGTLGDVGK